MTRQLDLTTPGACKLLAEWITADIDAWCIKTFDDGHRSHLGASLIGEECSRKLWYHFRWVKHELTSGRMYRLFNRGHLEEDRFISYLRGIGFEVWNVDPNTGQQSRIYACKGHFGGSLDGINKPPSRYGVNEPLLCEFKTKATGSGFVKLKKDGIIATNQQHYAQMCSYGKYFGIRFALYMCVNKNDDDLHIEVIPLNWALASDYIKRADYVINTPTAPEKIAVNPSFWKCKACDYAGICWKDEAPEINCRSCKHASPVDNAEWRCALWNANIPKNAIPVGCTSHSPITRA
jgi:hypothetical protein